MMEFSEIRKIPRFSGLTPEAEKFLQTHLHKKSYAKGERIFQEGDQKNSLQIVENGQVKIFKMLESGKEIILGIFQAGEAFGEVALLDNQEMPATAMALKPTTVISLAREEYLYLLEHFPESAQRIIRDLTLRLLTLRKHIEMLGESGVSARIARLLITQANYHKTEDSNRVLIPLRLTRQEVASLVGARIETVIRLMSRWQKEGLVVSVEQGFLIHDCDKLEQLLLQEDRSNGGARL